MTSVYQRERSSLFRVSSVTKVSGISVRSSEYCPTTLYLCLNDTRPHAFRRRLVAVDCDLVAFSSVVSTLSGPRPSRSPTSERGLTPGSILCCLPSDTDFG